MKKLVVDVGGMLIVQYLIFYFVEIRLGEQATFTKFYLTTLIISKKPGNTGISRDIRTEFTTDLLLSD